MDDIRKGEIMLFVPKKLVITYEFMLKSKIGQQLV